MKFRLGEITRDHTMVSHLVISSITGDELDSNKVAMKTITDQKDRNDDTPVDLELKFNGVEIDIRKFITFLDDNWDSAINRAAGPLAKEKFEKLKHEFKSKNSINAQLNRIRESMGKVNSMMQNIDRTLEILGHEENK